MKRTITLSSVIVGLTATASANTNLDFDPGTVNTAPSQAPSVWYTDRYAPAGFDSAFFDGDHRLKHSINANDSTNARPSSFSSPFYDTQGRKYDIAGTTSMSIDLYLDPTWAATERRQAGFWGTALDGGAGISGFPIIEFTTLGADRFRYFSQDVDQDANNGQDAGWIDLGLPTGFAYDRWYTLSVELIGGNWEISIGDLTFSDNATQGSVEIGNVILQGYNTSAGVTYDIYWDNFSAIPTPGAASLAAIAGLAAIRRRRA